MKILKFIVIGVGVLICGCGEDERGEHKIEKVSIEKKKTIKDIFIEAAEQQKEARRQISATDNRYQWIGSDLKFKGKKIEGADPFTFQIFGGDYSKDENNVYYYGGVLDGIDPLLFNYLGGRYSRDDKNIYHKDHIMEDIDFDTFEVLNNEYAKDKNAVYKDNFRLEGSVNKLM